MSKKAGIRELKNQASRIVSEVREDMAEYVITSQGNPVAVLRPFTDKDAEEARQRETREILQEMKSLAAEISAGWNSSKDAREILEEGRS